MTDDDSRPDKPQEYTYRDYMAEVQGAAEVAVDALEGDDPTDMRQAVTYATNGGDHRYINYGHMLMTVLLSDTMPDNPKYCEAWHHFVEDEERWASVVQEMAWVCYYSDVFERALRIQAERDHPAHVSTEPDDCKLCIMDP
jgi:hypothetical protein